MSSQEFLASLRERQDSVEAQLAELSAVDAEGKLAMRLASGFHARELVVSAEMTTESVQKAIATLQQWQRLDAAGQVRIVLTSGDAHFMAAVALYDCIRWLRLNGTSVTVEVAGDVNASAVMIVQAADRRLINEHSVLELAELSETVGRANTFELGKKVEFSERLLRQQRRLLTERSDGLDTRKLARRTRGRTWHLSAQEALDLQLFDGIASEASEPDYLYCSDQELLPALDDSAEVRKRKAVVRDRLAKIELARLDALQVATAEPNSFVVPFYGTVNQEKASAALDKLAMFARRPGPDITVQINSPGGIRSAGLGLVDYCRRVRASGRRVNTEVLGYAASMGGIMLQMGEVRTMGKNSWLLIHRASGVFQGTTSELRETHKNLMENQLRSSFKLLAERSIFTPEEILERCYDSNWWLTAQEAVKYGFADQIR